MKKIKIRLAALAAAFMLLGTACASNMNGIKGSATDRTGTNGATNGNGKVAKTL